MSDSVTDAKSEPDMLAAALKLVEHFGPVIPLCWPEKGACAYGEDKHAGPHKVGKVPLNSGVEEALTDPDKIAWWWKKWPLANIGVRIGPLRLVLDLDSAEAIAWFEEGYGRAIETVAASTPREGGGRHVWFALSEPLASSMGALPVPGAEWRTGNTYVVCPPSLHVSGGRYEWIAL